MQVMQEIPSLAELKPTPRVLFSNTSGLLGKQLPKTITRLDQVSIFFVRLDICHLQMVPNGNNVLFF